MLRAPRQDLARPVRAVETMTASLMDFSRSMEGLSFGSQPRDQRGGLPEGRITVGVLGETFHGAHHVIEADRVRVEHRPPSESRKAIPGEVHHVDVGSAKSDSFFQNSCALVDQRENRPLDDLIVGNPPRSHPELLTVGRNELLNRGVRDWLALAGFVAIPAGAGLLPEASKLANTVRDAGVFPVRLFDVVALSDVPTDVVAGEIGHPERTHRHTPALEGGIDLLG